MESSFNNPEFDEYCSRLDNLIKNIETNLKNCNKKYKDKHEIEELYSNLTNFLNKENLNDSKLYDEITFMEKDLRRSNTLNEASRKKMIEYKEKIKNLNTELKSMRTMLDKSNNSWSKFNESYETIEQWLDEQENLNDISNADFSNYQKYQRLHAQFNDSASFLLQVSDPISCSQIKEQLLYINKLWKSYQDKFKDTNYEQHLKYYECEHSLNMIKERLTKIENLINKQCKCNLSSVGKYQEEIQKAFNDLECLDANLKLILKLTQRIELKQNKEKINEFKDDIKITEAKLIQLRNFMPDYLKKLTKIYTHISSIEDGLQNIEYWVIEGESLLKTEPDQLNFDQIIKQIEKQKKHFNDTHYHENSISSKSQLLQTLKQLTTQNFDLTDLTNKLNRTKELLANLKSKRLKWEELFQAQQALWRAFHSKTKQLEEWIMKAQKIVSEKNEDYNFLIHKHKDFFDNINNEILHGFLSAGQKLVRIKNENDKNEIKTLMDTLEGQWKMIMTHAPVRLLRLQFKRLENLLKQEIKEADAEISEEFNALNENKDVGEILKRHEAKFKHSDFFPTCESYLQGLKTCKIELADKKVEDKTFIEDAYDHLQTYWHTLTQKIEALNAKLTITNDTPEDFERNLTQLDTWLYEIEATSKDLFDYNLTSSSEYRRALEKTRNLLNEFKSKQSQLTTTINQFEYLSKRNQINEAANSFLSNVKFKFDKLLDELDKIENRASYLDVILKISSKIDNISNKIRNLSTLSARRFMAEEDDSSLHEAVEEQKSILDQMKLFEKEIDQLKHEANSLSTVEYLQMPTVVYEKLNCVQESIRHSISEELERRSSLLEIRQVQDQRQSKLEVLAQNLDFIEQILSNKNLNIPIQPKKTTSKKSSFIKQNETSLNIDKLFNEPDEDPTQCTKQKEYSKYLKRLAKCKEIICNSRRFINEIKLPAVNLSSSVTSFRAQTPSNAEYQQVREHENKLDAYERDIDFQIEIFEQNLARQVRIDKNLDELSQKLSDIVKRFEAYNNVEQEMNNINDVKLLEIEQEKSKRDLEQLELLKIELNQLIKEKRELLEEDNRNLNRSRIGTLLEGFNETILDLDMRKDHELNLRLNEFIIDLNLVEENFKIKLSEIKFKLNQQNISKKQRKLNLLRDTLDLQLDTLIGLKKFQDSVREDEEEEFEDLRKESANILLERGSLDESNVINSSITNINQKPEIILTIENEKITEQTRIEPQRDVSMISDQNDNLENQFLVNSDMDESQLVDIKLVHETTNKKILTTTNGEKVPKEVKSVSFCENIEQKQEEEEEERIEDISVDYILENVEHGRHESRVSDVEREEICLDGNCIEEDIIELERKTLECELLEKSRKEREKEKSLLIEFEKLEALSREAERLEILKQQQLERERIEQEAYEMERLIRMEREKLEKEKLEMERSRHEREALEMERLIQIEREKLEREKIELEKQRAEKEQLEREKLELERERLIVEREMRERERQELEREAQFERERIEMERLELERIEKERIDLERQEWERIQKIEKEREERLRQEMAEIERIRNERAEKERLEFERIEKERIEAERQQAIKKKQQEEAEAQAIVERQKQLELEALENEKRRKKLEQLEQERIRNQEKLKLEFDLKEICEALNNLKEKINSIQNEDFNQELKIGELIRAYESELNVLDDQVLNLYNQSTNLENKTVNPTNSDYYLFDSLDQATLTQFELIRSFLSYLNSQIDTKKKELNRRIDIKSKLNELEANLEKYVELAVKFKEESDSSLYVQNILDLENRIESIESIENSIQNSFKQIIELYKQTNNILVAEKFNLKKLEIELNTVQPLLMHLARLKQYLSQWKHFELNFSELKEFLREKVRLNELMDIKNTENLSSNVKMQNLDDEFEKYSNLRENLVKKLTESDELFLLGTNLFNISHGQQPCVLAPNSSKDFNETREDINEISRFLDEKCAVLKFACIEHKKLITLDMTLNGVLHDLDQIELDEDESDIKSSKEKVTIYKSKLDRLGDLKKKLRIIMEDKEKNDYIFPLTEINMENTQTVNYNTEFSMQNSKFQEKTKQFNVDIKSKLEETIKFTMDRLTSLETDYHQRIMQNLPSRNALNELDEWLKKSGERLDILEHEIETNRPIDLIKLDLYRKNIIFISDEMLNEREIELKFILESIENEVKQGFYDLSISEKSAQLEIDWNRFKQRLNSLLEKIEIALLKLNEFNRSTAQIKTWIITRNKQNEYENLTKFKTNFDETTIIMDDLNLVNPVEDEKDLIKQILSMNQDIDEIKSSWQNDKIVNDSVIRNLVQEYISIELEEIKKSLDNIELINKVKIENNLTQLKQNYTTRINELNLSLQNEINFITHGKLSSYQQYSSAIRNVKFILEQLEDARAEMKQNLKKFELDLKSTDLKMVLNLAKTKLDKYDTSGLLLDPHLKHSILNNLTNRDLENSAKNLIYLAEQDLIDTWRKYEDSYKSLLVRLEQAHESISSDLVNLDSNINSENLILKSNLFEQTLNDMIKNKSLFENLESISEHLLNKLSLNENLKIEIGKNKEGLQEKFKVLSSLADKLSAKLDEAGREHKNFLSLVEFTQQMILQANKLVIDFSNKDLTSQFSTNLKAFSNEIELSENKLKEQIGKFKNLNVKDSERIAKICELTSTCTTLMSKQRDLRMQILDQIQERNYLFEIRLNDIESYLNSYANYLTSQFGLGSEQDPNLLERYYNCLKYMLNNEFELSKCERQLDQLEIEINDDKQRDRSNDFKQRIGKFRKQIKIVSLKDGLYDKMSKLRELKQAFNEIDYKKEDETRLISFKEEFLGLKFTLEKLIQNMQIDELDMINPEVFKTNCLNQLEAQLNSVITKFLDLNELNSKYKAQAVKIESCLNDLHAKFMNAMIPLADNAEDMNTLEIRLNRLSDIKCYLTSEKFKAEMDLLEVLGAKLESSNDFQLKKIKYLDLVCDLDKAIKKIDFDLSYLKKIVEKSQKMLDLIKDTHKLLASVKLVSNDEQSTESSMDISVETNKIELRNDKNLNQILDFLRFNILEKLNENESIKNEILDLYAKCLVKSNDKSELIKDIIDKLLYEWNLINEKCVLKIKKFELFKTRLNDLDFKLGKIREYCCSLETYLEEEMFKQFDLTDLKQILSKKAELENLFECLKKKDSNTECVLKMCISANKSYFSSNKQNLFLILSLKDRWFNLKILIKDKLFKLSNVWLFLCDINDQIENFYLVLEKTETFYKNTLLTASKGDHTLFKLIEELYSTINQDYKLIKYLNESFVNFSKFVFNFDSNDCLNKFKQKLLDINSRWDHLHNEIAIKLRLARKTQSYLKKKVNLSFVERLNIWLNEISLLITNLEHISTKELQLKINEVQELKKEICEQTEEIFQSEDQVLIDDDLIERVKSVMKRILRLDSYIQQSVAVNAPRTLSISSHTPSLYSPLYCEYAN